MSTKIMDLHSLRSDGGPPELIVAGFAEVADESSGCGIRTFAETAVSMAIDCAMVRGPHGHPFDHGIVLAWAVG